jgi:ubiquinone/menaquinone biosynthesis C-methylase UbiE
LEVTNPREETHTRTKEPSKMPTNVRSNRWSQIVAWIVAGLFIAGFFLPGIGAWTGPTMAVWFVLTQRPLRGFLWMVAINYLPGLLFHWRSFPLTGPVPALEYLGWSLLAVALGVLPFVFHRLTSPRLPGLLATLPFPLAAVAFQMFIEPQLHTGTATRSGIQTFLTSWFAAVVVWMWNQEFRAETIARGATWFATIFFFAEGLLIFFRLSGNQILQRPLIGTVFVWSCAGGAAALSLWAALRPGRRSLWAGRADVLPLLQSPFTGEPLHVVTNQGREALVSSSGEQFPVRNGIPTFLKCEDLTGDNGKYNHLYETIGGFYDDTQRFFSAFRGIALDSYFRNYRDLLEVKPGDSVLETSVGTGLNFKYLPRGVKLSGLDLSQEMLTNCQANMTRWGFDADLYLGNAERLPFADASFDVVYTAGAFNFFTDRAKAIREMIRVAKPGSHLMIEDETEEYVKSTYENIPFTSSFYKDRKEAVTVPIDLVPPEMEDVHLEMLKDGKFYAITFRKPAMTCSCSEPASQLVS